MKEIDRITPDGTSSQPGFLSPLIYVFLLAIIVPTPYIRHVVSLTSSIIPAKTFIKAEIIGTLAQIIVLSIPLIPMSLYWPKPEYRAIYRSWLFANCLSILTLPIYFIRPTADKETVLLHIMIFGVICACLVLIRRRRASKSKSEGTLETEALLQNSRSLTNRQATYWLLALLIVSVCYLPWLAKGALGSFLDTFLQLSFGLLIGFTSIYLLDQFTFQSLQTSNMTFWSKYFLGGSVAAVTLLLLASATAFPYGSMQILLMLTLPGLGWSIAALVSFNSSDSLFDRKIPLGLLVGLTASAPMVMFDPDELILILNTYPGEILGKAIQAAFFSILIILLISVILAIFIRRRASSPVTSDISFSTKVPVISGIALLLSLMIGGLAYTGVEQKGFHGDYIFVILKDQADITAAQEIPDYYQRRQFVYRTLVEHADTTQKALRVAMNRFGIQYKPYYLVNGFTVPDNPFIRLWIQTRPEIDRILDNPQLRPLPEPLQIRTGSEQVKGLQWNLTSIGANRVWEDFSVRGESIIIGQSDSGVQGDHPELADSYRGKGGKNDFNWFDPWNHTTSPNDVMGHGTHTLGSIVGKNTGVAPMATWIACVNLARNLGNPAYYLDCMQFMLAPFPQNGDPLEDGDPTMGAQVLNNSWGCPDTEGCDPNTFLWAVRALRAAGVFFVAGAGNDGPSCGTLNVPPPIYQETFAVGAIDRGGTLANFSSIGPVTSDGSGRIKPDILAPGVNVLSSLPGSSYGYSSGTSMAGPHVVGVVALIWSANPDLIGDIERTEQILIQTASPYTGYLPDCPGVNNIPSTASGYGIVDAYAAVKMALEK